MFPMIVCLYKTYNINVMSEYRVTDYFMIMRVVRDAYTSCIIIKQSSYIILFWYQFVCKYDIEF